MRSQILKGRCLALTSRSDDMYSSISSQLHRERSDAPLKGEMRPLRNPVGPHEVEDLIDDET